MSLFAGLRPVGRYGITLAALCALTFGAVGRADADPTFGHAAIVQRSGEPVLEVDGAPFFFWGGAFFYERIPAVQWRRSMLAMRDLGANTLDLYVPWNWHELSDDRFDFSGTTDPRRNLREVLRLGAELGFHFIVRPGPVIRNEWRNGGYPAWLLTRPEYDMPKHDVLEGRYPATATLQNANSDDAAAEWMRNQTHLLYASRWLHRVLEEFRPYADRVIAVQLDDDQAAYIDNQTYPAPNLHRYLAWLEAEVREVVGPLTPTFINTYQMRVPTSSPVWTMGNWYQSEAYSLGLHDRVDLDFSTLLLATNRRGPLAQSEFQAGWLAGAEDPTPRPADPRNTTLALDELLALGVKGVIDFPMQDTHAEPGWEAPFSNAAYNWDAALSPSTWPTPDVAPDPPPLRFLPTKQFGIFVTRFAPVLLGAHRVATIAIAYGEPPPRRDSRVPDGAAAIVARVRSAISACITHGDACDLIELNAPSHLERYATIVLAPELARAAPVAAARLRSAAKSAKIVDTVPDANGPGTISLAGPNGRVTFGANWSGEPLTVRFGTVPVVVASHSVRIRLDDVALSALGGDARRLSSDCNIDAEQDEAAPAYLVSPNGCTVVVRGAGGVSTMTLAPNERLSLPALQRSAPARAPRMTAEPSYRSHNVPDGQAVVERTSRDDGGAIVTLRNDQTHITIDANAGGRAFSLLTPEAVSAQQEATEAFERQRDLLDRGPGVFDATGALRDDLDPPLPASPRDYIAKYTHDYPAGTFNRPYAVQVISSGKRAAVEFSYTMPDDPAYQFAFDRIVSLEPASPRVVVDESLTGRPAGVDVKRAVVRSSLPFLSTAVNQWSKSAAIPLDAVPRDHMTTLAAAQTWMGGYLDGIAFVVCWPPGAVERATWTPYRSTGTLSLTLAPGWQRTIYAAAPVPDLAAAQRFVEAERAWVAANPHR